MPNPRRQMVKYRKISSDLMESMIMAVKGLRHLTSMSHYSYGHVITYTIFRETSYAFALFML